jgi:alkyl hydroperoxide reductase subunit D
MDHLDALRARFPDEARDLKVNLQNVLTESTLTPAQAWGCAVTAAYAAKSQALSSALLADADDKLDERSRADARAAHVLMGMNNVLYRSRHMLGKESYEKLPARLRMTRIAQPASSKLDFELYCVAASAVNGCEVCLRAHEKTTLEAGLTEAQVFDAIRIAAVMHGAAAALDLVQGEP